MAQTGHKPGGARTGWANTRIPEETVARIQSLIESGHTPHKNISDFVSEAAKRYVEAEEDSWMRRSGFLDWLKRGPEKPGDRLRH